MQQANEVLPAGATIDDRVRLADQIMNYILFGDIRPKMVDLTDDIAKFVEILHRARIAYEISPTEMDDYRMLIVPLSDKAEEEIRNVEKYYDELEAERIKERTQ